MTLRVSQGPQPLDIPTLVGQPEEAARTALGGQFDVRESKYVFDQNVAESIVISAFGVDREGNPLDLSTVTQYWEGQPVTLTVSLGPIPDVRGLSVDDAQKALADKGLVGSTSDNLHDWSDEIPKGSVLGVQLPEGTEVTKGTELQLIVSDGVEQVEVPDVVGETWRDAKQTLENAGFSIEFANPTSEFLSKIPDSSTVKSIDPDEGKTVDKGSTVKVALKAG